LNSVIRRRAYSAALVVVAVAVASLIGENTRAGDAAVSVPRVEVTAQVTAANTVPGGAAEVLVVVSNVGRVATSTAKPAGFTIAIPPSLRFVGAENLERMPGFGGSNPVKGKWSCSASAGTCRFGSSLPVNGSVAVLARFEVAPNAQAGSRPAVEVTGTGIAAGHNAHATLHVISGKPSPALFAEIGGTTNVRTDKQAVETIDILNVGSGPATTTGGLPSIQLSNLIAPTVVGSWSAKGRGWTCTGASGTAPTCTSTATVPVGKLAPRLTITFQLDPTRVADLHLQTGGKPSIQRWFVQMIAYGGQTPKSSPTPATMFVTPPPGALLVPSAVAVRGLQELLPGAHTTVQLKVTNIGGATTDGRVGIGGRIPAGTSVERVGPVSAPWTCRGGDTPAPEPQVFSCVGAASMSLAPRASLTVDLVIKAAADAKPGEGTIGLSAIAENEIAAAKPRETELPLLILEGNAGFPALSVLRATGNKSLEPATDGAPAKVVSGQAFTERLDVRDAGGAAILAGSHAELTQHLVAGAHIASIKPTPGWACSGTSSLTCTVTFAADLAPAATLEGPTVVITAGSATAKPQDWPATIKLTGSLAKAYRMPIFVTVDRSVARLVPNFTNQHVPTAGGIGSFGLNVHNDGNGATNSPVQLGIHLPPGVRFVKLSETGWKCSTAATSARCTSAAPLQAGHHLPHMKLVLSFGAKTTGKTLLLSAHASDGARPAPKSARSVIEVSPRRGIRAVINEPEKVAFDVQPLVRANEKEIPTVITLEGDGSGGNGLGVTYEWTQRCLTVSDAGQPGSHCTRVTPPVHWLGRRREADTRFATPRVLKPTFFVFDLSVTDGSAHSTAFVRIKVLPLPTAGKGFTIRDAHPKPEKANGPATEKRSLPRPAEKLKNTAPPKKDTAIPAVTAAPTDTTTTSTTTTATTTTTGPALPPVFCQLVRDAINSSGSFSASIAGGVSFDLNNVNVTGTACSADTTVSFSGSGFKVHSYLEASGVAGTISKDGISFSAGTLTGPAAWGAPTFTIGSGISIPFGGGSVSLSGTVTAGGFAFVPLPSGWHGTTSVTFGSGSAGTSVSVSTTATGPKVDASPNSAAPTATVQGSVSNDGTFSLAFDIQRIVQLAGSGVNVAGHVTRAAPGGPISAEVEGSLVSPVQIVPGLLIKTLKVKVAPTETSLGISAEGTLALAVPSGSAEVNVKLAYDNPANWSLTAEGAGDAAWTPLPGLTVASKDFSGAIVAKDDKYELTLKVALSNAWKPTSNITVSNLVLNLSNVCPNTGAPCPPQASVFLDLKGDVAFALPTIGTAKASIAGSLALPTGEFSVEASLTQALPIAAGITIDNATVLIQHGMKDALEEPSAEAVDGGAFRVDLMGGITVPGIGKLPTVHASFSSKGWAVAVPLGGFSLPGASGDGSKLSNTVLGWSSYATTMSVVDPATKAVSKIALSAGAFKLTGNFATPAWLRQTLKLPGDVKGRATGIIDPANDTYSLRMEFDVPGQPYLYGTAGSATNIKLKTTFFEISRQGADFNLALGGTAGLTVAATASAPASSVDLSVALSFALTSQTVTGTLSFSSPAGWQNAFGAKELTLYDLAIQFQFNIPTLTPAVGFGARAVLPPTIRQQLGVVNGARTTIVANISVTNPCLGIQVDDPTGKGVDVLSIGNTTLTAKAFLLQIAPTGCTVGQFKYAPGFSVNFDGKVAGVSLAIKATLQFVPFTFDAVVDVGEFPVGGMTIKKTHVEVSVSTSKVKIAFSGGVEAFGTNVDLTGGFQQNGTTTIADFTGTLDKLALGGDAVTANNLKVKTHIETGPKTVVQFSASGAITLLGSSANGNFDLSLANGQLNSAKADVVAAVKLGGANGLSLDGTFKLNYSKTGPFTLDAAVNAKFGTVDLAKATVSVKSGYVAVTAAFSIGNVFTADIAGAAYYGAVPSGTKIPNAQGTQVAAQTGDFYLTAKNVSLTVAGFKGTGNVWVGRAGGVTGANLDGNLQIVGTSGTNTVGVAGSIDTAGNFSLAGSAALDLAGFKPTVAVTVKKAGQTITVSGKANIAVAGSNVDVSGDFRYDGGKFLFRLNGEGNLKVGTYNVANAAVRFSNFPEDAGLSAQVAINAGSIVTVNGRLNFVPGGRFSISAQARLNLPGFPVDANVTFANYATQCVMNWAYLNVGTFRFPYPTGVSCGEVDFPPRLDASATVGKDGYSFGVAVTISADGSFRATARAPVSGETVIRTGTVSFLVVRGYAQISYHASLTLQSASPVAQVDLGGRASIQYAYWTFWDGWSSDRELASIAASLRTNPFQACGYASVAGQNVGGCVP
jgi:hypothetical protein